MQRRCIDAKIVNLRKLLTQSGHLGQVGSLGAQRHEPRCYCYGSGGRTAAANGCRYVMATRHRTGAASSTALQGGCDMPPLSFDRSVTVACLRWRLCRTPRAVIIIRSLASGLQRPCQEGAPSRACAISQPIISALSSIEPSRPERPLWPVVISVLNTRS